MTKPKVTALCLRAMLVAIVFYCSAPQEAHADDIADERPKAIFLFKLSSPTGSVASFGRGAAEHPASRDLKKAIEAAAIGLVSAAGITPSIGDADVGLPISNAAALAMAREAGVGIAVVVGVEARSTGRIRTTTLTGLQASLRLRVLDVATQQEVHDQSVQAFGYGQGVAPAVAMAVAKASADIQSELYPKLARRWPRNSVVGAAHTVSITGADRWPPVAAIVQQLAATEGIAFVHVIEIRSTLVRLSVMTTQSITSLIASLRRARIRDGKAQVSIAGHSISIALKMAPPEAQVLSE